MKKLFSLFIGYFLLSSVLFANAYQKFPDVPADQKNFDAISFLAERNILQGYPDGTFKPEKAISRVEALKILLLGSKRDIPDAVSSFPDVSKNHWGQKFIAEAAQEKIVNGDGRGNFRPDDTVSLAEALKMLLLTNKISPEKSIEPPYSDVPIDSWFAPYASYAKTHLLLNDSNVFQPSKQLTRGELAELMYRLAYMQENELSVFVRVDRRKVLITSVYDGDTITAKSGEKIRIIGIDAPEKGQVFDPEATALVKTLVLDQEVWLNVCAKNPKDRYGRTLSYITTTKDISVSEELLQKGYAKAYFVAPCGVETGEKYQGIEIEAKKAKLGIWQNATEEIIPAEGALQLLEAHPDATGDDNKNMNGEFMVIQNSSEEKLDLTGYTLKDGQNHEYVFPSFSLEPKGILTVFTGIGRNSSTELYIGSDKAIWNNAGDTITILDSKKQTVFQKKFIKNQKF